MKTAVESIIEKIKAVKPNQFCSIETILEWCEQAKEMEKQQTINFTDSYILKCLSCNYDGDPISLKETEQYYKETFKSK